MYLDEAEPAHLPMPAPEEPVPPSRQVAREYRIFILGVFGEGLEGIRAFFARDGQVANGRMQAKIKSQKFLQDIAMV